jgi:hypothetical protein
MRTPVLALVTALMLAAAPAAQAATRLTITGAGFGHGIGMSQYGAYGMARNGYSSSSIIAHYYRGASASPAALPATSPPASRSRRSGSAQLGLALRATLA